MVGVFPRFNMSRWKFPGIAFSMPHKDPFTRFTGPDHHVGEVRHFDASGRQQGYFNFSFHA
jgi:hypothetical protein